jgi:hypothetical protein
VQRSHVQSGFLCVGPQHLLVRRLGLRVEDVMEWPELSLRLGTACGFVRLPSLRVQLIDRKVAKDEPNPIAVTCFELCEHGLNALAEGTVEILELHDRHRCRWRSLRGRPDQVQRRSNDRRRIEVNDHLRARSQSVDERLAPSSRFLPL